MRLKISLLMIALTLFFMDDLQSKAKSRHNNHIRRLVYKKKIKPLKIETNLVTPTIIPQSVRGYKINFIE